MELTLALCRFVHYVSLLLLFGASFYLGVLSPTPLRLAVEPRLQRYAAPLVAAALSSALLGFLLTAWSISGEVAFNLAMARDVLTDASYGRVSALRALPLIGLACLAGIRPRTRTALALSGLALAGLALTGHAAMQEGWIGAAHRANDALHLLLVGGWLGGLPPFVACLRLAGRPETRPGALAAMMRFSLVGHFATPLIFVTGAVNVALTAGVFPWPWGGPYQVLLDLKVLVFAAMLAIALANRYFLVPRIARAPYAAIVLRRMTAAESVLSLLAVLSVSFFGLMDPT